MHQVLLHSIDLRGIHDVADEHVAGGLVVADGEPNRLRVACGDQRVQVRVGVAGAAGRRVRHEQVVEPVLRVVVVGAPALPEHRVCASLVALVEEGLLVDLIAADLDAEILLPLIDQVLANGDVEGIRVVGVREVLHLGSSWVPRLVLAARRGWVELRVDVGPVAEVPGEAFAEHAARRGHARGAGRAHSIDECVAVDRRRKSMAAGLSGVTRERTTCHVEAHPERHAGWDDHELIAELGVALVVRGRLRGQRLAPVADEAEHA